MKSGGRKAEESGDDKVKKNLQRTVKGIRSAKSRRGAGDENFSQMIPGTDEAVLLQEKFIIKQKLVVIDIGIRQRARRDNQQQGQ